MQAHGHAAVAQVVAECLHDFLVGKLQQLGPLFDQGDAHAERGEHAGVLDADDAAAHHDQRFGQVGQVENLIAVDDRAPVDRHPGGVGRLGPGGDDDVLRLVGLGAAFIGHLHVVGVFEAGDARQYIDAIARELRLGDIDLGLDHVLDAEGKVRHRDLFLDLVVHAIDGTVVVAGEMQHGFAHCLAGDGAGIYRNPAHVSVPFHHGCPLAQLIGIDSGALPRGAGTNDE